MQIMKELQHRIIDTIIVSLLRERLIERDQASELHQLLATGRIKQGDWATLFALETQNQETESKE